ncbi:MAG: hypothetical protein E4G94_03680 [ANME-2 cluster archaeon]|nr:MAG: hypothetical protein E4G94_03680 [ANME-2 cluster archaeon]
MTMEYVLIFLGVLISWIFAAISTVIVAFFVLIMNKEYLFSIDTKFEVELNTGSISEELKKEFGKNRFSLLDNAAVTKEEEKIWVITDKKKYIIRKEKETLNIYTEDYKNAYHLFSTRYEKWFSGFTTLFLLYLAFHLSSKGFTGEGIPIVSETYSQLWKLSGNGFFANVSPQDICLGLFAFVTIIFIFGVVPRKLANSKIKDDYIVIGSFAVSFLFALFIALACYFVYRPAELVTITAPTTSFQLMIIQVCEEIGERINLFILSTIISLSTSLFFYWRMEKGEAMKEDFINLLISFCLIPAIILGPLALAQDELIIYPNYVGHAVVGLFFISGFLTLMFLTMMFFKTEINMIEPWLCSMFASLAAISSSCFVFLWLKPMFIGIDNLGQLLLLPISFMLIVLAYGMLYERMSYRIGEWWIRRWKPLAMILSIVLILIIAPLKPTIWKLVIIIFSVIFAFFIPYLCSVLEFGFNFGKRGLPKYFGGVLIKISPGMSTRVRGKINKIKGVYQTMVVTGPYDVYATIEAIDAGDFTNKIREIGETKGVTQTITLKDITEVIEKEVMIR